MGLRTPSALDPRTMSVASNLTSSAVLLTERPELRSVHEQLGAWDLEVACAPYHAGMPDGSTGTEQSAEERPRISFAVALGLVLLAFMAGGFVTALTANVGLWGFVKAIGLTVLIVSAAFVVQRCGRGTLPPDDRDEDGP